MSWTYGQRPTAGTTFLGAYGTSWGLLAGAAVSPGTLAVLHITSSNAARLPSSVTDSAGNVWVVDKSSYVLGAGPASVIVRSVLTAGLTSSTSISVEVPASGANTTYITYTLDTFINASPAAQIVDGGASNTGTATAVSTGPTPDPSSAGDLCLAGFAISSSSASLSGFPSGYTALAVITFGSVSGVLVYNLNVSTSQDVTATLSVNISWAAVAQLYSSTVLGADYPIGLNASESVGAALSVTRGYLRPALAASIADNASLGLVKSRILKATVVEGPRLTKVLPPKVLQSSINVIPTFAHGKSFALVMMGSVSSVSSLRIAKLKKLPVGIQVVAGLSYRPGKTFSIVVRVVAGVNKKGTYRAPPAVLQLYDLTDVYQLPALKGATVSYMHGIFGEGVMFDIYEAYVTSGGPFYVTDNGLKQALSKHAAVVRVF